MKKYFLFLFLLIAFACSRVTESAYVVSTSSGEIGVKMPIYIRLMDTMKITNELAAQVVTINPKVDLNYSVLDNNTIAIKAVDRLQYDTDYEVTLNLDKLTNGVEGGNYIFKVSTVTPRYSYVDNSLTLQDSLFYLDGEIRSSDYVESDYIEKNFKVSEATLPVKWVHSENGMVHNYKVENIECRKESYELKIERNYHVKNKLEVVVPAEGEYDIMTTSVLTDPLQVVVTFSTHLKQNQNFDELVTLCDNMKFNVVANKLIIYPSEPIKGTHRLTLSGSIKNFNGRVLPQSDYSFDLQFPELEPSIKFIGKGSILPSSNDMTLLFQSVNYTKAQVRVKKIYSNNLLQFFQVNPYGGGNNLELVAAVVKDTVIVLERDDPRKLSFVNNYALNLSELIVGDKGAMYRVEIRGVDPLVEMRDYYESDYYFGDYETYDARSRNILQSDLGIIAKGDDNGGLTVFTTNLLTAKAEMDATVVVYNAVNQQIATGTTDGYGRVEFQIKDQPFIILAEKNGNKSYLKVDRGSALSVSNFDVAGANVSRGIKGYIFGERGVWRPGDDIYLTFVATSKGEPLPENHPAKLEFRNPQGQLVSEMVRNHSKDGIYCFRLKTDAEAPTGNWEVKIVLGGEEFRKNIKIESIKPNRMKIDFRLNDKPALSASDIVAKVNAKWLHGAVAKESNVKINVELSKTKTEFKGYKEYVFDDPSRSYSAEEKELFSSVTDANGNAEMRGQINGLVGNSPGMLNAKFTVKVFEKSGDFSIDQCVTKLSPYDTYVGVQVKEEENNWGDIYLNINDRHTFHFVALDVNGKPKEIEKVKIELYKMSWNWWWDAASENAMSSYAQNSYNKPYSTVFVSMVGGKGSFPVEWKSNEWGRYLIRVTDLEGGHSAMKMVYVDESYGRNSNGESDAATRLSITKDKEKYSVGESATLTIPSSSGAKALVSIENGTRLMDSYWVDCESGKTNIKIPVKEGMSPNVYVSVTMVQPHKTTSNDAPIRMYGVLRLRVEDKGSRLTPVVTVADKVRPETEFSLTVSEKNGAPMSYVVAIVDDGLLDLTRFKTPDPWSHFNADEALGVRTWDLFDNVIGAYGGRIEQLFAVGGDDEVRPSGNTKAERFKPVVYFLEAQKLGRGKSATHKIKLPPYFGSVRVMVIASNGKAQGSAEKRVEVKKPLMVQMTLPRVLSTDEEINMPVTIFAMEENVGNVKVELVNNDLFTVIGEKTQSINSKERGEEMVYFRLKANQKTGIGKVSVKVSCKDDSATATVEIDLRNPNPLTTYSKAVLLNGGSSQNVEFPYKGTKALVELSTIPAIDLSRRLEYLISYPHGCIEQIVSGAFPQLYIGNIMNCDAEKTQMMEYNVKSTLDRLRQYQLSSGAFAYWSGSSDASNWGTIYAGHFMTEAAKRGYSVNGAMKNSWKGYVSKKRFENDVEQCYALYVLALGGTPERGMMNRMREKQGLNAEAAWFLAGAYALDGKPLVGGEIVRNCKAATAAQSPFNATFSSPEREMAVMLVVRNAMGEREKAFDLVKGLAKSLNNREKWLSTQSIAWSLNSIANYLQSNGGGAFEVNVKGESVKSQKSFAEKTIGLDGSPIALQNKGTGVVYAVISTKYIPEKGEEIAKSNGLKMNVSYRDFNGQVIDPVRVAAGTDFFADVAIRNTSDYEDYTNLALTHILPSGWEISRNQSNDGVTRRDVRDDRVLTYFDLKRGEQKLIRTKVTATYRGHFYLPAVYCEAMYDGTVNASTVGTWSEVL